jgi:hypothetical protein
VIEKAMRHGLQEAGAEIRANPDLRDLDGDLDQLLEGLLGDDGALEQRIESVIRKAVEPRRQAAPPAGTTPAPRSDRDPDEDFEREAARLIERMRRALEARKDGDSGATKPKTEPGPVKSGGRIL